jgi:trans-aconitate methyltransferase
LPPLETVPFVTEPYHRYVFDTTHRRFVGEFEAMYAAEDAEGFDSWHQERDRLSHRVTLAALAPFRFRRILDVGCGKGAFTAQLHHDGSQVLGVDMSSTAIAKAAERHPECDWRVLRTDRLGELPGGYDLAVAMEILSYIEDWRDVVSTLCGLAERVWMTLYLPPDPIGFVKSFEELRAAVASCATIEHDIVLDRDQLCLLARSR